MPNKANQNQSNERTIYHKDLHQRIPVSKSNYDNCYCDINVYHRRQQEHERNELFSHEEGDTFNFKYRRSFASQHFIEIEGQKIPVTEEVYQAYMRPVWAEQKRSEREKRCRDENGNRCTKDCSTCSKTRLGTPYSLDSFREDFGFEPVDKTDVEELVADKLLLDELFDILNELDPGSRRIIELYSIGLSEREIATEVGISQKAVNKRKNKLFTLLQEKLKNFV